MEYARHDCLLLAYNISKIKRLVLLKMYTIIYFMMKMAITKTAHILLIYQVCIILFSLVVLKMNMTLVLHLGYYGRNLMKYHS